MTLVEDATDTIDSRRRTALGHDALLFCGAFSLGALVYALGRIVVESGSDRSDYWSIGLSDGLVLSGLLAGELFIVWNNGLRQGARGHSIGKHRVGLAVVGVHTQRPVGVLLGLVRGVVMAVLVDLTVAAVPIGLPTVLRRLTPDRWHVGGAAYVGLLLVLVILLWPGRRNITDRIVGTVLVSPAGPEAVTRPARRRILVVLDVIGVLGVVAVASTYVAYYSPMMLRFTGLF